MIQGLSACHSSMRIKMRIISLTGQPFCEIVVNEDCEINQKILDECASSLLMLKH